MQITLRHKMQEVMKLYYQVSAETTGEELDADRELCRKISTL